MNELFLDDQVVAMEHDEVAVTGLLDSVVACYGELHSATETDDHQTWRWNASALNKERRCEHIRQLAAYASGDPEQVEVAQERMRRCGPITRGVVSIYLLDGLSNEFEADMSYIPAVFLADRIVGGHPGLIELPDVITQDLSWDYDPLHSRSVNLGLMSVKDPWRCATLISAASTAWAMTEFFDVELARTMFHGALSMQSVSTATQLTYVETAARLCAAGVLMNRHFDGEHYTQVARELRDQAIDDSTHQWCNPEEGTTW